MGVNFKAEGMPTVDEFDCGYVTYGTYRNAVAQAIDEKFAFMYRMYSHVDERIEMEDGDVIFKSLMPVEDQTEDEFIDMVESYGGTVESPGFSGAFFVSVPFSIISESFNDNCDSYLESFFASSDCEGEFSPDDCAGIYEALKDYEIDHECTHYGYQDDPENFVRNTHQVFLKMFKFCVDNQVDLVWS